MDSMFVDAVRKVLSDRCTSQAVRTAEESASAHALWAVLQQSGFADLAVAEDDGGAGLQLPELSGIAGLCGEFAVPVPLLETIWARGACGGQLSSGPTAFAPAFESRGDVVCNLVVLGRTADWALVQLGSETRILRMLDAELSASPMPLDCSARWSQSSWRRAEPLRHEIGDLQTAQAGLLSGQIAGALLVVLAKTLDYANQRKQFGKSIGKFQAVQHQLSIMAEHAFAARAAAHAAFETSRLRFDSMRVALAKARCSSAACEVTFLAHAIHGAIGITDEYDLQLYTRRLHAWRQAAGAESFWHRVAGRELCSRQVESAWDVIRCTSEARGAT